MLLLGVTARLLAGSKLIPNSLFCLLLSSSSTFFSPAASRINAAFVKAGFLIEPLPDWVLERVGAFASSSGSHSLEPGGGDSPASPCLRKAPALDLPRLLDPDEASLAEEVFFEALWLPSALASMLEETGDMHGEKGDPMFQGGKEAWVGREVS